MRCNGGWVASTEADKRKKGGDGALLTVLENVRATLARLATASGDSAGLLRTIPPAVLLPTAMRSGWLRRETGTARKQFKRLFFVLWRHEERDCEATVALLEREPGSPDTVGWGGAAWAWAGAGQLSATCLHTVTNSCEGGGERML